MVRGSLMKVTSLRRMSMGMIFAALAFVVSGFVQYGIEGKPSRIRHTYR